MVFQYTTSPVHPLYNPVHPPYSISFSPVFLYALMPLFFPQTLYFSRSTAISLPNATQFLLFIRATGSNRLNLPHLIISYALSILKQTCFHSASHLSMTPDRQVLSRVGEAGGLCPHQCLCFSTPSFFKNI